MFIRIVPPLALAARLPEAVPTSAETATNVTPSISAHADHHVVLRMGQLLSGR
jgi:hypothetical protein